MTTEHRRQDSGNHTSRAAKLTTKGRVVLALMQDRVGLDEASEIAEELIDAIRADERAKCEKLKPLLERVAGFHTMEEYAEGHGHEAMLTWHSTELDLRDEEILTAREVLAALSPTTTAGAVGQGEEQTQDDPKVCDGIYFSKLDSVSKLYAFVSGKCADDGDAIKAVNSVVHHFGGIDALSQGSEGEEKRSDC